MTDEQEEDTHVARRRGTGLRGTEGRDLIPRAGFILAGNHPEGDPRTGLEQTLRLFAFAEDLGYDVAGIRQRHLERGISSALPFLAAASQRTSSIRLETDVVPLGYETPFRLAEDFGTVDALSGGRVNVGISTSSPHGDLLGDLGRGDGSADPYALIERFLEALEGRPLADEPLYTPYGPQIPRIEPHIPGLRDRVWLGGGSERSVRWAARHGLKLLLGNLSDAGGHDRFEPAQRVHLDVYYSEFAGGRHAFRGRGAGHRADHDRDRAAARALPGIRRSARRENGAARGPRRAPGRVPAGSRRQRRGDHRPAAR